LKWEPHPNRTFGESPDFCRCDPGFYRIERLALVIGVYPKAEQM